MASFGPERRSRVFAILNVAYATPAVAKMLRPCSEPKSTISGWTLINVIFKSDYSSSKRNYPVPETECYFGKGYSQVLERMG
jgi:hypothetical protein